MDDRASILSLSLAELASKLRRGDVKALEVLRVFKERTAVIHEACNAVVAWCPDAESEAMRADEHLQRTGQVLGPLHGIPCTIKDHLQVRGLATGLNSITFKKAAKPAKRDDPQVAALRSLGAIPFAKSTMTQFGDTWGSGGPADGDTLNPWDTLRSPAGSSSGEGVLVGGGASPFGIGSDIGGSLRLPSANCGICTLKPTCGRLAEFFRGPGEVSIPATSGVMAKTAEDVAMVYSVLLSETLWDADNFRMPRIPFRHDVLNSPRPLRVGYYIDEYTYPAPCPTARRAVEEVVEGLKGRGHEVVPFRPRSEGILNAGEIVGVDMSFFITQNPFVSQLQRTQEGKEVGAKEVRSEKKVRLPSWANDPDEQAHPDLIGVMTTPYPPELMLEQHVVHGIKKSDGSSTGYTDLLAHRDNIRTRFYRAWNAAGLDVLVCPTISFPAVHVEEVRHVMRGNMSCRLFNFMDMPAGHVTTTKVSAEDLAQGYDPQSSDPAMVQALSRCFQEAGGLPMGVHVAALPWQEELCLRAMCEVSKACPFAAVHSRLTPVPRRTPTLGARPELMSDLGMPKSRL